MALLFCLNAKTAHFLPDFDWSVETLKNMMT